MTNATHQIGIVTLLAATWVHAQSAAPTVAYDNLTFSRPVQVLSAPVGAGGAEGPGESGGAGGAGGVGGVEVTGGRGGGGRLFVVEQNGRVVWFEDRADVDQVHVALDVRGKVSRAGNEEGLLGMAFHPDFSRNRQVFLFYTHAQGKRSIVARLEMDAAGERILPVTRQVLIDLPQPYPNHNGGALAFGPDGYLYISFGDGGSANDPHNHAQNLTNLYGTIARIDVNRESRDPATGAMRAYAVPEDNPFVKDATARPEIYAYGLRNVWRMSFDRKTGRLWAADVGQANWEEVNLIQKGGNYGWRVREGRHPFRPDEAVAGRTYWPPVAEHDHAQAKSITGGVVYRGEQIPSLQGRYIYGDYQTGLMWSLDADAVQTPTDETTPTFLGHVPSIAAFGFDTKGEVLVVSLDGRIYRLVR